MHILPRLPRESGRDYALRVIKENIIHLNLEPGSIVSENELSRSMGLSRTPVREALHDLSKVCIVEVYPQRGSCIALIDYQLVEEARFMRNVLECAVIELVCEMATEEQMAQLSENLDLQVFYEQSGMREKIWELDNKLHAMFFAIAKKEQTNQMLGSFTIHFDRVRNMSLTAVKDNKNIADHRAIIEAVKARDAQSARRVMEHHLQRYKLDEQALRESYPNYFVTEE